MSNNYFNKMLLVAGLAVASTFSFTAEASNLDTYRNIILSKNYTLKCTNITPTPRETNKDKVPLYGKANIDTSKSYLLANRPSTSLVVSKDDVRYQETGFNIFFQCQYQDGDKTYNFTRFLNGTKTADIDKTSVARKAQQETSTKSAASLWSIIGLKKATIKAVETNYVAQYENGIGFGNDDLTRVMNAFLPDSQKGPNMRRYRYAGSGWLGNGMNYVDYRTSDGGDFEAIRYYFNGYTLVKIASGQYYNDAKGNLTGRRTIIRVDEFTGTPDMEYIKPPQGVKLEGLKKEKEDED